MKTALIKILENIDFKINIKSGITVGLVNLPLSIALAVAAGIPPTIGIITAVWAGLFMSLGGGSRFNIVGPAAAIIGILSVFVASQGYQQLPLLSLVTASFLVIALITRLYRFVDYIPHSVLVGFTLGVAVIIFTSQLRIGYGLDEAPVYIASILFLFFSPWKKLPGTLLLFPLGIILSSTGLIDFYTLSDKYPSLSFVLINPFSFNNVSINYELVRTAFLLAAITMVDCLLSARIAKNKTKVDHSNFRELVGLVLANGASGLAGGMPATASLSRTALNVQSGATNHSSAIFNAISIAFICLLVFNTFAYVPMVVIGAILTHVALKLVSPTDLKDMYHNKPTDLLIVLMVALLIIFDDPLTGILSGVIASLLHDKYGNKKVKRYNKVT